MPMRVMTEKDCSPEILDALTKVGHEIKVLEKISSSVTGVERRGSKILAYTDYRRQGSTDGFWQICIININKIIVHTVNDLIIEIFIILSYLLFCLKRFEFKFQRELIFSKNDIYKKIRAFYFIICTL